MKIINRLTLVAASLLASATHNASYAADNASWNVNFNVSPTVCDVTVDSTTNNIGVILNSTLPDTVTGPVDLVANTSSSGFAASIFTVTCGGPVSIAFKVTDGNSTTVEASAPANVSFGLGEGLTFDPSDGAATTPIGYYKLKLDNIKDTNDVVLGGTTQSRANPADPWVDTADDYIQPGTIEYTKSSLVTTPLSVVKISLTPEAMIHGKDVLDPAESHTLAGSYTTTVVY